MTGPPSSPSIAAGADAAPPAPADKEPRLDPILDALLKSASYLTPAIVLCLELPQAHLDQPEVILRQKRRIDAAIRQTEQEIHEMDRVLSSLRDSPPVPATSVPAGF